MSMNKDEKYAENSDQLTNNKSTTEVRDGISITHEQVADTLIEGTIDGTIEANGKNMSIKREGY